VGPSTVLQTGLWLKNESIRFRSMRIAAIQDFLRTGGTEAQFLDLTARWSRAGHEVRRIVFRRGGGLAKSSASGPPLLYLQPFAAPFNWWAPRLRRVLEDFSPDRVVCFGRNAHRALSRVLESGNQPGLMATMRSGRKLPSGYRRILRDAETVVANSHFGKSRAADVGADPTRIFIVENGCRLAEVPPPDSNTARASLKVGRGDFVFLCMGSFVPGKSQDRLLEIWEKFLKDEVRRKSQLWFVGEGPRRATIQKKAEKLSFPGQIKFWGDRSDPEQFFAAADATISVSREESAPNALVESLWFGTPVLATACAGVEEIVGEGDGRIFPDSPEGLRSLAHNIESMVLRSGRSDSESAAVASRARERFDPDVRAADYLDLFMKMGAFTLNRKSGDL